MRKRAPAHLKESWAELEKAPPRHKAREEFMTMVLKSDNFEDPYFKTLREFGRYTEDGEEGE